MAQKLYIGGIAYQTDEQGLRDAFAQAGEVVSAQIIMDKMTGRSRGFGFVEMATPEAAQAAIDMWHNKELDGRKLIVNEARPQEKRERSSNGGSRGGFGGGSNY